LRTACALPAAAQRTNLSRCCSAAAFAAFSLICASSAALSTTCGAWVRGAAGGGQRACMRCCALRLGEPPHALRLTGDAACAAHRQRRVDSVQAGVHVRTLQAPFQR
jgi:hypothetical protein